jgi:hypothetical protein
VEGPDPLAEPLTLLARPRSLRRQVDLATNGRDPGGMQFGLSLECRLRAEPEPDPATLLMEEHCSGAQLGGFTNRFWVAAETGAVLRSAQWIGPNLPYLVVEEVGAAGP